MEGFLFARASACNQLIAIVHRTQKSAICHADCTHLETEPAPFRRVTDVCLLARVLRPDRCRDRVSPQGRDRVT